MTNFQVVYDAFLGKLLEDEWALWDEEDMKEDWKNILKGAIPQFKFPRVSLDIEIDPESEEEVFSGDLDNEEVQILATYMKCEWLNRTILTWENVKPLYEERDFSQANLIDKFRSMLEAEKKNAEKLEAKYYRSIKRRPFDYTKLAT
jgi:hypothetical protein